MAAFPYLWPVSRRGNGGMRPGDGNPSHLQTFRNPESRPCGEHGPGGRTAKPAPVRSRSLPVDLDVQLAHGGGRDRPLIVLRRVAVGLVRCSGSRYGAIGSAHPDRLERVPARAAQSLHHSPFSGAIFLRRGILPDCPSRGPGLHQGFRARYSGYRGQRLWRLIYLLVAGGRVAVRSLRAGSSACAHLLRTRHRHARDGLADSERNGLLPPCGRGCRADVRHDCG